MPLVQGPHFKNHWSRERLKAFSTMHLFTWYKNPVLLKHFYNSDAMRATFTEKELWSDDPFWLAATPPMARPLPLRSVVPFHVRVQELSHFWGEFGFVYTAAWALVWMLCICLVCLESIWIICTHGDENYGRTDAIRMPRGCTLHLSRH